MTTEVHEVPIAMSGPHVHENQAPSGPLHEDKTFISYNAQNQRYAEWIAWHVERWGFPTILQAWDFRPGSNFVLEMQAAACEASRTIAILSPSYLASHFTQPEWAAAFLKDPKGKKRTLIPVVVEPCEIGGLLSGIVRVDLVGVDEQEALKCLFEALSPGRAKPKMAPPFPGESASTPPPAYPGAGPLQQSADMQDGVEFSEFPPCVFGLGASQAKANFRVGEKSSTIWVEFEQSDFSITTKSAYAIKDDNPFAFQFPVPGAYPVDFEISAKEAKDLNGLVTVTARSGRLLLRRTYRISVFALRKDSALATLARLLEPLLLQWKALVLGVGLALVLVASVFAFMVFRGAVSLGHPAVPAAPQATAHAPVSVTPPAPGAVPTPPPAQPDAPPSKPERPKRRDSHSKEPAPKAPPPPVEKPDPPPAVPVAVAAVPPPKVEPAPTIPKPNPLELIASEARAIRLGEGFSASMTAKGGSGELKKWTSADLPDGIHIDSTTGDISGAPTEAGNFVFHVAVSDGHTAAEQEFHLSVTAVFSVFFHVPVSAPLPVMKVIKNCLAKFFVVEEDKPAQTSFWCTKCSADEVKFELRKKAPPNGAHRAADVLWSDSFPAEVNGTFDTEKAMKQLCYGSLGLKQKFSSIADELMEVAK